MNFFVISPLINFITSTFLFLLVISRKNKEETHRSFLYFCSVISFWSLSYFIWQISETRENAIIWTRILMIGAILIPAFYLKFVASFLGVAQSHKRFINTSFVLAALFNLANLGNYLVQNVLPRAGFKFWPIAGPLFIPFLLYFFVIATYSSILLAKAYRTADSSRKEQIKYILLGLLLGFIGGSTNYFLWLNIPIKPCGNILVSFYVFFATYAIITRHLMDIRLVARKYLVYSAYVATIGVFFILTKLAFGIFIPASFVDIVDLVLLIIAVLFTSPIKNFYFRVANKYFFSSLYDSSKLIAEISEGLRSTIELDKIFSLINFSLKKTLHLKSFAVLVYSEKDNSYSVGFNDNFNPKKKIFPYDKYLNKYYIKTNLPIVTEELKRENNPECAKTVETLKELGVELLIPLNIKNETIGLLALGKKEAGDIYNDEDLNVLKVISSQAAVAIDNALLYDEVSKFNETLQDKVDEQTKEIQAKAEHLKKLMDMRSEFLDITSHQLRTPVSVIKGVLSMLEEGSIPPARVSEFIRGAMEKAIKLGEIINDILRASEMDTDKFTMTVRPVDLNEMMTKIQEDKRRTAEMRSISMVYEVPPHLPLVLTDPKYVEHAIINLINNSLQYTIDGSITTSVEVNKTHVVVRVSDTGIGIPKSALPKLFTKFARAENAVTTFTDGTGLGLFIIKQIVDANPGAKIEVERTEVGKGTTFALWLPIAFDPKAKPVKTSAK